MSTGRTCTRPDAVDRFPPLAHGGTAEIGAEIGAVLSGFLGPLLQNAILHRRTGGLPRLY
jgi:hypothetical protein